MKKLLLPLLICFTILSCKKTETPAPGTDTGTLQPTACFNPSASTVKAGQDVTFTNCSEKGSSYEWNFGDGATSTQESPVHKFTQAGTFTVKLTAYNADKSKKHEKTSQIIVEAGKELMLTGTTSKSWQLTRLMIEGEDYTSYLEQCTMDNLWIYHTDKRLVIDEGRSKCDMSDPQSMQGSWTMDNTGNTLTMTLDGEQTVVNLDELSATTLRFSSNDGGLVEYTFQAR